MEITGKHFGVPRTAIAVKVRLQARSAQKCQAGSLSTRARSSGWLATFISRHTLPVSSMMHTAVSLTEQSIRHGVSRCVPFPMLVAVSHRPRLLSARAQHLNQASSPKIRLRAEYLENKGGVHPLPRNRQTHAGWVPARRHPMTTRIRASMRTRQTLSDLIEERLSTAAGVRS